MPTPISKPMHDLQLLSIKARVKATAPEINLSPLIDVVFLLLIFFMVTTVFPEKDGIIIEKPESEHAVSLTDKNIIVKIDASGKAYYQDKAVNLKDLTRLLKAQLQIDGNLPVIIHADKKTQTEALLKVIDAVKSSGAKQLGLAADEKAG